MINVKIFLAFLYDFFVIIFSWVFAYTLRFNFQIPDVHLQALLKTLPLVLLTSTLSFYFFGLYRGIWRFASITDLKKIISSSLIASLTSIAFFFMFKEIGMIPRSVLVIYPLLLILIMGGSRFIYRIIKEHRLYSLKVGLGEPIIIIGSGQNAILLAKELNFTHHWRVVGILDDNKTMHGLDLAGIPVLGSINQLSEFKERFNIHKAIISAEFAHHQRREIIDMASGLNIEVLIIPVISDFIRGRLNISQMRPIEVEDLLGRDKVDLNISGLKKLIKNKVILISGAGGSIG